MEQQPYEPGEFGAESFAENPEPRVPCVLLLDVSYSMSGAPIDELNKGLVAYKDALVSDGLASKRVEISIITFGSEVVQVVDFTTAENFIPPTLEASGMTPMGKAVDLAMEQVELRKQAYKTNGIAYYRPWLFLITDGEPNDAGWEEAASRALAADKAKSFAMFCVGTNDARSDILQMFTPREPLRLDGLRFGDMFLWLSRSQQSVSRSTPGDDVALEDPTGPAGWASIS